MVGGMGLRGQYPSLGVLRWRQVAACCGPVGANPAEAKYIEAAIVGVGARPDQDRPKWWAMAKRLINLPTGEGYDLFGNQMGVEDRGDFLRTGLLCE